MRHKTITLCPTTYEIAKDMPNFSKWVRQELLKKHALIAVAKIEKEQFYEAWCQDCDLIFRNKNKWMLDMAHYCTKCYNKTSFLGLAE